MSKSWKLILTAIAAIMTLVIGGVAYDGCDCGKRTVVRTEEGDSADAAIMRAEREAGRAEQLEIDNKEAIHKDSVLLEEHERIVATLETANKRLLNALRLRVETRTQLAAGTIDSGKAIASLETTIDLYEQKENNDSLLIESLKRRLEVAYERIGILNAIDSSQGLQIADLKNAIANLKLENAELQPALSDNKLLWMAIGAVGVVGAQQIFK